MKILKKIIMCLAVLSVITVCSKDVLDVESEGQQLESTYFKNDDEVFMGLVAAYDVITWNYDWGMSHWVTLNSADDDANAGGASANDRVEYVESDEYSLTVTNAGPRVLWRKYYTGIYRCNIILELSYDSEKMKRFRAEAKFLRAYYYFDLVNFFGDVPLVDHVLVPDEYYMERTDKSEIYALIIKDLEEAIPDLPLKTDLPPEDRERATKGAAKFLLGKTYLFLENWSKAAEYFEDIISSGIYDLEENYADIVTLEHEFGIESIFEINYTMNAGDQWDYHHDGNVDLQLCGVRSLAFFVSPAPDFYRIRAGWGFLKPTTDIVDAYIAANDTLRLNANIILGDSLPEYLPYFRNFFLHSMANWTDAYGWEGFIRRKYQAFSGESNGNQYDQNFIVYRYGDLLLMLAEAKYRSGQEAEARDLINQVRARASLDPISSSGQDLFNDLVTERRLELAFEAVRYWDVLRWGMADQIFGALEFPKQWDPERKGLWPIPQDEIERTGGSLKQNDGY
jgi:hypothetical protein